MGCDIYTMFARRIFDQEKKDGTYDKWEVIEFDLDFNREYTVYNLLFNGGRNRNNYKAKPLDKSCRHYNLPYGDSRALHGFNYWKRRILNDIHKQLYLVESNDTKNCICNECCFFSDNPDTDNCYIYIEDIKKWFDNPSNLENLEDWEKERLLNFWDELKEIYKFKPDRGTEYDLIMCYYTWS